MSLKTSFASSLLKINTMLKAFFANLFILSIIILLKVFSLFVNLGLFIHL